MNNQSPAGYKLKAARSHFIVHSLYEIFHTLCESMTHDPTSSIECNAAVRATVKRGEWGIPNSTQCKARQIAS